MVIFWLYIGKNSDKKGPNKDYALLIASITLLGEVTCVFIWEMWSKWHLKIYYTKVG